MSTTEYRLSRRRARAQDGEEGGGLDEAEGDATPPPMASGSQRIETRMAVSLDPWSTFDAETAELDLPAVAVPPAELSRTKTEPMPAEELAEALATTATMNNAATLSGLSEQAAAAVAASGVTIDPTPVTTISFGDQPIWIVHRGAAVELILPGGQRLTSDRGGALALAEALVRGFAPT